MQFEALGKHSCGAESRPGMSAAPWPNWKTIWPTSPPANGMPAIPRKTPPCAPAPPWAMTTMLAEAVLARPKLRSLTAARAMVVFCVAPPLALIFGFLLLLIALILVGVASGAIIPRHKILLPLPVWFDWTVTSLMFAANFLVAALLGSLMRGRTTPALETALAIAGHGVDPAPQPAWRIPRRDQAPWDQPRNDASLLSRQGPLRPRRRHPLGDLLGQAALLCLPMTWLVIPAGVTPQHEKDRRGDCTIGSLRHRVCHCPDRNSNRQCQCAGGNVDNHLARRAASGRYQPEDALPHRHAPHSGVL